MKSIIILLYILVATACGYKQENVVPQKKIAKKDTAYELMEDQERLVLIATKKKMNYDTAFCILNEYFISRVYIHQSIDSELVLLSNKYQMSKPKIAGLIMCFKYPQEPIDQTIDADVYFEHYGEVDAPY